MVVTSSKVHETGKAKEGGVRIERVRKAKDGKIIIGCKTKKDIKEVEQRISKAGGKLIVIK